MGKCISTLREQNIITLLKEISERERNQDLMLTRSLELYVPIIASNGIEANSINVTESYTLLNNIAEEFLKSPNKLIWLVQGSASAGKSLFGRYLEKKLWDSYTKYDLLPLFISLYTINDFQKDLIKQVLKTKGISKKHIKQLKKNNNFLFILDGYDDIDSDQKIKLTESFNFNRIAGGWKGKVIISCRVEYLEIYQAILSYLKYHNKDLNMIEEFYIKSYIMPFQEHQITHYIEQFCGSRFNIAKWSVTQHKDNFKNYPAINTFLKEPLLLFLTLTMLPQVYKTLKLKQTNLKKIDIYDMFISAQFDIQYQKILEYTTSTVGIYNKEQLLESFNSFLKDLSYKLFIQKTLTIKKTKRHRQRLDSFFAAEEAKPFFEGIILKQPDGNYCFIHKSIQNYFIATKILEEIANSENIMPILEGVNINSDIIELLLDRLDVIISAPAIEKLFKTIERTKNLDKVHNFANSKKIQASSNAATILSAAKVSFSGRDLKQVNISGANLSGAIMDDVNLEGANLRDVKLNGVWMPKANLKYANMVGISMDILVYKQFKNVVCSCAYSTTQPYFAAAIGNDIIVYHLEKLGNFSKCTILTGHTSSVHSIAFSPNNKLLVSGSLDNTLRIWDLANSSNNQTISYHNSYVYSVAFSADNRWIASGGGDNIIHLRLENNYRKTLYGHKRSILALAFSFNNLWLASGSEDKTVRIWSLADFNDKSNNKTLSGHTKSVCSVSFSNDNKWLASGSCDNTILIWNVQDFTKHRTIVGHLRFVNTVAFSPDSKWLASGSSDNTICIWSLSNINYSKTLTGHNSGVNCVVFSPNNKWLASSSSDCTLRIWALDEIINSKPTSHINVVNSVAFSSNHKWLASGGKDNSVILWSLLNFSEKQILVGHNGPVTSVGFSVNNKWLVSTSYDCSIRLWYLTDIFNQDKQKILIGHNKTVNCVSFSSDNDLLASGSNDKTVRLWKLEDYTHQHTLTGHTGSVTNIIFNQNNEWLACATINGIIYIWDLRQYIIKTLIQPEQVFNIIRFSLKNAFLSVMATDNELLIFNMQQHYKSLATNKFSLVVMSPDDSCILAVSKNNELFFWELTEPSSSVMPDYQFKFCYQFFFKILSISCQQIQSSLYIATGGADNAVCLWLVLHDGLTLIQHNNQHTLNVTQADITDARIFTQDAESLKQLKAIGSPVLEDMKFENFPDYLSNLELLASPNELDLVAKAEQSAMFLSLEQPGNLPENSAFTLAERFKDLTILDQDGADLGSLSYRELKNRDDSWYGFTDEITKTQKVKDDYKGKKVITKPTSISDDIAETQSSDDESSNPSSSKITPVTSFRTKDSIRAINTQIASRTPSSPSSPMIMFSALSIREGSRLLDLREDSASPMFKSVCPEPLQENPQEPTANRGIVTHATTESWPLTPFLLETREDSWSSVLKDKSTESQIFSRRKDKQVINLGSSTEDNIRMTQGLGEESSGSSSCSSPVKAKTVALHKARKASSFREKKQPIPLLFCRFSSSVSPENLTKSLQEQESSELDLPLPGNAP